MKEFNNDRLQFKQTIRRSNPEDIAGTGEQQQQQPGNETKQQKNHIRRNTLNTLKENLISFN